MNPRRSWLILPAHDPAALERVAQVRPDVAVFDLEYSVPPKSKELARSGLKSVLKSTGEREAAAFVRIERESRWADVRAAIHRGIRGIVVPGPEEVAEVIELADLLTA